LFAPVRRRNGAPLAWICIVSTGKRRKTPPPLRRRAGWNVKQDTNCKKHFKSSRALQIAPSFFTRARREFKIHNQIKGFCVGKFHWHGQS